MKIIQLFEEIDINGDGSLQWEEFSNHLIELGELDKNTIHDDLIQHYFLMAPQ